MCQKIVKWKWKKCAGSKWWRPPVEKPTKEQVEIWVALGHEMGRRVDEEYRNKLISMYGKVPDWAPERIRRV